MHRISMCTLAALAVAAAGCSSTTARSSSGAASSSGSGAGSTGSSAIGGSSASTTTGAASTATASSTSTSTTSSTSTSSTSTTGSSTGATTTSGGSSGSTGNCYGAGIYVTDPSLCCSGQVDSNSLCVDASSSSTSGTTTTGGSTGTTSSSSTSGGGLFNGGWHPADAGYQAPLVGDGGTTVFIASGAPSNAPSLFGGGADSNVPTVVYPPDGVLVPPNMNALEIHFIPGSGQSLFELDFHAATASYSAFTACNAVGNGCVYALDASFWTALVDYARGGAPVTYTVKGVNGASPGLVGTSASRTIAFSDQDITAGIYYWNTGGTIDRFDWGLAGAPAETWMDQQTAGATFCVGCHAISRQGDQAVVGKDIPEPANYGVYDVATRTALQSGQGDFFSFSPDGQLLLISDGITVSEQDMITGNTVNSSVASGTMPDWSPSGAQMIYAKGASSFFQVSNPGVSQAALHVMQYNGSGFANDTTLVSYSGQNNYYPSYAPTGDWVVFNRSPGDHNSFDNAAPDPDAGTVPDGQLWAVASAGGSAIPLDNVNNDGASSWPKWAPVLNDYYGGKVLWLTFSSMRGYGLRLPAGQQTQLFMVGFDPARAANGQDPSFPAFYLPFQDSGSGNHIAQWVTSVVRKLCQGNSDCPSNEICTSGKCTPPIVTHTAHLAPRGGSCKSALRKP